jgi:ribosomal protein S18 acetylase RimI-like enzyme
MFVREYRPEDRPAFGNLAVDTLIVDFQFPETLSQEDLVDPEGYYLSNGGQIFVVENDQKIIGSVAISKVDPQTARICRFYIQRDFRSIGLGKKLLTQAIDFCKQNDYQQAIADVWHKMEHAIKLYEKYGFLFVKEENGEIFMYLSLK